MLQKWSESDKNTARELLVAGGDHSHDNGRGRSQMKEFSEGKLSKWSTYSQEVHWHRKIAQKVVEAVGTDGKNVIANNNCNGANGEDWYGTIANRKAVIIIPVQWPEGSRSLFGDARGGRRILEKWVARTYYVPPKSCHMVRLGCLTIRGPNGVHPGYM